MAATTDRSGDATLEIEPLGDLVAAARLTRAGRLVAASEGLARLLGHPSPAALVERGLLADEPRRRLVAELAARGVVDELEASLERVGGEPLPVVLRGRATADGAHVDLVVQPIGDLAGRRQRSQDAAKRLLYHLKNTPLGVIEWNLDFEVVEWNAAAEQIFGYSREEALGRHAAGLLVPAEARPHVDRIWADLLARTGGTRSTNPNFTKGGEQITCDWYNTTLVDADDRPIGVVSLVADISEMAAIEAELAIKRAALQRAEKLASLGVLVAGIAHEIKNPLNFIINFAELSLDQLESLGEELAVAGATDEVVDELVDNLRRIHEQGHRVNTIVNAMLMHAREAPSGVAPADLNELVRTHAALAWQSRRSDQREVNVEIEESYDPALSQVPIAYQQLSRVVLNLVVNALDALAERARRGEAGYAPRLKLTTTRRGDTAEIRIRDNGVGISEELRGRIFEAFFTTKPAGEGTGLGLSMCYDIVVNQLGGRIDLLSVTGEYSEFNVLIPI